MVDWDYYKKFKAIMDKYLPPMSEGETKATQIVTAVNKLVYKWYNDGDVYDNTYYLDGWCNNLSSYANWLYRYAGYVELDEIEIAGNIDDYEQILKDLADALLDEDYLEIMNKQPKIGSIYKCEGKFKFEDKDDYEEEW